MNNEEKTKLGEVEVPAQIHGELDDAQLEQVAAGTSSQIRGPVSLEGKRRD
ncbi:hypothetical protein [Denitratisoma sp. agr-D3]